MSSDDVNKAIAELRSMRVDGLPSDISDKFDHVEAMFRAAKTAAQFAEARSAGIAAAQQFDAWRAAGSPRESWLTRPVAGPVKSWHFLVGGLGVVTLGALAVFLRRRSS
jgi:hypothetical protein